MKDDVTSPAMGHRDPLQANAYARLPAGAVTPRGWLRRQLRIQADGLTSWLWSAFTCASYDANPPYHQEGVIALALVLQDERLMALARGYVDRRLMGNSSRELSFTTASIMRYMMEYQEATGDGRIVPWMTQWYQTAAWGVRPGSWAGAGMEEHLDPLLWLYHRTGDVQILEWIKRHFDGPPDYQPSLAERNYAPGNPATVAEAFLEFPEKRPCDHGVTLTWKLKYPALLYRVNPQEEFRRAVMEGLRRLDQHYGQIGGRFAAHERLPPDSGRDPRHGTELCNTVEAGYNMARFFEWFGDPAFMDRLESLAFNVWPGEMTPDMWAHQYDTQANQAVVSVAERGWDNTAWANLYGLMPHWTCCLANMHQAWPRFVRALWMATPRHGLAATAYGPCEVTAKVGDPAQEVTLVEETGYPFRGDIRIQLRTKADVHFPLELRIPDWAAGAAVSVGAERFPATPGTMLPILRTWRDGDTVTISFPMGIRTETRFRGAQAVLRGPLYFALRIGQTYREAQSSNPQQSGLAAQPIREQSGFPVFDWEILPATPWNFGLMLDPGLPDQGIEVACHEIGAYPFGQKNEPVFRRVAADPRMAPFKAETSRIAHHPAEEDLKGISSEWSLQDAPGGQWVGFERTSVDHDEPVVLRVKARRIPEWTLEMGRNPATGATVPAMAGITPQSPLEAADAADEVVDLVPYGCTRLRISEFPVIPTGGRWSRSHDTPSRPETASQGQHRTTPETRDEDPEHE